MQPAGRLARQLLDVGQEGDDVVPGALLDLENAPRVELAGRLAPHLRGRPGRYATGRLHGLAGG